MKRLFFVKHGNLDADNNLCEYGKGQMNTLGNRMRIYTDDGSVLIVAQPHPFCVDSAEILAESMEYQGGIETDVRLFSRTEDFPFNDPKLSYTRRWVRGVSAVVPVLTMEHGFRLIDENRERAESLVLVTDSRWINGFSYAIPEREFRTTRDFWDDLHGFSDGAFYFDIVNKAIKHIPSRAEIPEREIYSV